MRSISMRDVARQAGCSATRASQALHHPEQVSSSLRQRVLQAAQELGYAPRRRNTTLKTKEPRKALSLGLFFEGRPSSLEPRPMSTMEVIIEGMEKVLRNRAYTIHLRGFARSGKHRQEAQEMIREGRIDAMISYHLPAGDPLIWQAHQAEVPQVFIGEPPAHLCLPSVQLGWSQAFFDAWSRCLEAGHERVGLWLPPRDPAACHAPLRAMADMISLAFPEDYHSRLVMAEPPAPGERHNERDVLESMLNIGTTAFLCVNRSAYHHLKVLLESMELAVPRDCSLVVPLSHLDTALMHQGATGPRFDLRVAGEEAARVLLHRLKHPQQAPRQVVLPARWQDGRKLQVPTEISA